MAFAVSRFSWRFNVHAVADLHRRQPAAAAGDLPAAVPDVQGHAVARLPQRHQHRQPARHEDRRDHHPRRVPDRVLHVRAQQLHEDDPEGVGRGGDWSTAPASCASSSRSSCRCAGRRSPRWPRWSSPGCTTTSSGRSCCSTRATSGRSRRRSPTSVVSSSADDNLIAAASMIIAVPTLVVYLALQRQFISGLTLGANKG